MYYYIKNELLKVIYIKRLYLGYLGGLLFVILLTTFFYKSPHFESYFDVIKAMLIHLYALKLHLFVLGFAAFIYSVDIEERTMKIIRSKPFSPLKFLLAKYTVGAIYTFLFYLTFALLTIAVALLLFENGDFTDYKYEGLIAAERGWQYIFTAYTLQAYVSLFIIALLLFFAVIFENGVAAFFITFFIMLGFSMVGSKYRIHKLLPTRYMEIWRLVFREEIPWGSLLFYCMVISCSIILIFIATYTVLRSKEVKC